MKLMASGVTNSAASVRSPSFSRFSSSTTTTMRPAWISAMAPGTSMKGRWGIVLGAFLCCMKDAAYRGSGARRCISQCRSTGLEATGERLEAYGPMIDCAGDGYSCQGPQADSKDLELPPDRTGPARQTRSGDRRPQRCIFPGDSQWLYPRGLRHFRVRRQLQLRDQHHLVAG